MIFLVQFGINKLLLIFFKDQSLKKITRAHLFQIALEIMWLSIQIERVSFTSENTELFSSAELLLTDPASNAYMG